MKQPSTLHLSDLSAGKVGKPDGQLRTSETRKIFGLHFHFSSQSAISQRYRINVRPKLRLLKSSNRANPECKTPESGIGGKGSDKSVPKPSVEVKDSLSIRPKGYVGIATLARYLGISKSSLYDLVKSDPSFPFKNVGLKKKYVVNIDEFEQWLSARTKRQKDEAFKIPTGAELLGRYNK